MFRRNVYHHHNQKREIHVFTVLSFCQLHFEKPGKIPHFLINTASVQCIHVRLSESSLHQFMFMQATTGEDTAE
jgi:hypothetical protein